MANLFQMKQDRAEALNAADVIMARAEKAHRDLTAMESASMDAHLADVKALNPKIEQIESQNTISGGAHGAPKGMFLEPGANRSGFAKHTASVVRSAEALQPEYATALHAFFKTGGKAHGDELTAGADGTGGYYLPGSESYTQQRGANGASAATYEGSPSGGGYAVSLPTVPQIVPLAMPDLGIFDASMVIPTATNVLIPQQVSFGTSVTKAESGASIATFGGTDPTVGQIELQAYMVGALRLASWELLQDVEMWQQFIIDDLLKGQRILESQYLASGTGIGQPQGVFGNTGTGTGSAYALAGTSSDAVTILDALFDVVATLKGSYQANASWVMARATGLAIRRAQMQANLFAPVVTNDPDGTERILGKKVFYDVNAPALPTATTAGVFPILFGDFQAGNLIGVRGGAGINVKILDQPYAANGQLGILAYRRIDSRVRRSEAIQAIKFSHS
jgi:HK97 family phage major capsid protein